MALDASFQEREISPEMTAALQPRRSFAFAQEPEPHLYEKHGLAPGKIETGYSKRKSEREGEPINASRIPKVIHRNPNPPHINTTAPLGQRQGGYAQGLATGLFLRYGVEQLSENRYDRTRMLAPKHEQRIAEAAQERGIGKVLEIANKYRKDVETFENALAEDIAGKGWNEKTLDGLHKKASTRIHHRSNQLGSVLRKDFVREDKMVQEVADVFKRLGSESPITRAQDTINDIFAKLYRNVAETYKSAETTTTAKEVRATLKKTPLAMSTTAQEDMQSLIRDDVGKKLRSGYYDYGLGTYSLALTSAYAGKVIVDMNRLFSEVVAYEQDKSPEDVSLVDIWKSDNGVVQETWRKWGNRNLLRYATDGIFFGKLLKPSMNFGKFGLVSKGLLIMQDLWLRRLTTFEKLTQFVENVIKPEDGLGTPVSSEQLVDLFQSFTVHNRPDMSFQSVVGNNASEEVRWDYARQIFDRMADLMNQSYSYKHDVRYDENFQPLAQGNFTLPVFIFMLGHDMIDPNNPNFTMARIEIASEYGVQAMKTAHKEFMAAQHLPEAEQLPVFNRVMGQFPEAKVTWRSRSERLETAKSRDSAKDVAPLRPDDAPTVEHVDLEYAAHEKLEARALEAGL